jgi:hypothetical protein
MGTLMTNNSNKTENSKTLSIARPNSLRMVMLSAIILIAGIVIGSAATTLLIQKSSDKIPGPGKGAAGRMTHRLKERLRLTDEQFAKIEPIIKQHMDKLSDIQKNARPLIETQVNQMKEKISALLTDKQKEKWEKQMKNLERGFRMRRGPGPHGPRGDGIGGRPRGPRRDGQGGGPRGDGPGPGGQRRRPRRGPGGEGPGPMGPGHGGGGMWRQGPPPIHDQNSPL